MLETGMRFNVIHELSQPRRIPIEKVLFVVSNVNICSGRTREATIDSKFSNKFDKMTDQQLSTCEKNFIMKCLSENRVSIDEFYFAKDFWLNFSSL